MDNNLSANNKSSIMQVDYKNIIEGIGGLVFIYSENKDVQLFPSPLQGIGQSSHCRNREHHKSYEAY